MPKILIVDDEWLTRLEIEEMLTDLGYEVVGQAETGKEAVAMAHELNPDLILMDVVMPGEMNGIDAARKIKAELGTPIIFVSGYGDPEYIEAAKEIEPFGYVMKPFDEKEVHAFVEIALSKRALELKLKEAHDGLEKTNLILNEEIQAHKETERALQESEKLYRDIFEKNNAMKWLLDPSSGRIIDANPAACEFYQYSHEEITNLRLWDINIKGEDNVKRFLDSANSGEKSEFVFRHRLASGEIKDVQVYTGTLESNGKKLLHSIIIDITDRMRAEKALRIAHDELERRVESRTAELVKANKLLQEENELRKRSEEALRENERHLTSLMESASNFAVYQLIGDGDNPNSLRVVFVSPSITDLMGVSEPMRFETWFKNIHPDDVERIFRANIEAFETLRFDETMRIYHPQKQKWTSIHAVSTGFEDKEHQCTYVNGILIDVTREKKAEEGLRESEEKYRNLVEESFDGIFIQKGPKIIFTNKRLNEMLGYGEGELLGQKHWVVYHPDFQKLTRERAQARISGEEVLPRYEVKLQRKDGSWFHGEINARPITFPSNEEGGIQVWVKDIDERKQAEETLRESEEYHRDLFERSPTALFLQDFTEVEEQVKSLKSKGINDLGNYLRTNPQELLQLARLVVFSSVNQTAADLYNAGSKRNLLGSLHSVLVEDDSQHFIEQVLRFTNGEDSWEGEARNYTFRKEIIEVVIRKAVINRQANGLSKILASITDVTELHRAHKNRELLESQLQQAQKMEAVGTLAGGIAHDFNNILSVILGNTELASFDVPESNPASNALRQIQRASIRATDMVKQLLTFSRKSDEVSKPLDIVPITKESMKMLRHAVPTSVEFKQHISDDPCITMVNAAQINQIVMNLVINAADAMSEEGGLLEVYLENITLQEEKKCFDWVLSPGEYVRLKMRDTGEGIETKIMDRIFEPYYTTKEIGKGTGMGLSVVHGIVKRHGGGLSVESVPGKGTLFEIYFPALENKVEEGKELEGEIKGGSERILFVDDEESMVDLNRQRLEWLGYDVKSTTKPLKALEWFKADPDQFDVLITDMTMPRMTGDRLTIEVLQIRPHMPVIICTGYSERMSAEKAEALGVRKYIEKPIDFRNLASSLREVLDEK